VPVPSASEVEVAIGKLKRYKSPGVDQIPAELIQVGGETSGTKENCLTSGKRQLWYLSTKRVIKQNVVIIEAYRCCELHIKFYQTFFSLG
jgi:hypothetical protein